MAVRTEGGVEGTRIHEWDVWFVSVRPGLLVFGSVPLAHMGSQVAERISIVVSHNVGNVRIVRPLSSAIVYLRIRMPSVSLRLCGSALNGNAYSVPFPLGSGAGAARTECVCGPS